MTTRYNKGFPGARDFKNGTHFHSKVIADHDMKIQLKRAGFGDVAEIQAVYPALLGHNQEEEFRRCFQLLERRWVRVITPKGNILKWSVPIRN